MIMASLPLCPILAGRPRRARAGPPPGRHAGRYPGPGI